MKRRLKVLQLGSPSGLYGAERWILMLVKHLDPGLVESFVGVVNDDNYQNIPLCDEAAKLGVQTIIIDAHGKFSFAAITALRRFVIDNEIDVIHTHFYKTDLLGLLASVGTRCKVISTPHGWTEDPPLSLRAYEAIARVVFLFLDRVVPLSEGLMCPLQRVPVLKDKLQLIRNAVDTDEVAAQTTVASEVSDLAEQGKFVIGYIGRLTPGKGLDTLLKMMARHAESNWHAVLVGEGEQEDELRALVEEFGVGDRVHFFGFRPDRLAFLKGFDVFALPSRSEGIPRCLMESQAAGVPIVATDIPGCRNLVDGESTGLLFPVDDAAAMAAQVLKLDRSSDLRERLARHSKAFVNEQYSPKRMASEYEALYENLIH